MMREGRWREIGRAEVPQSESGRWPGADRRRATFAAGSATYGEQPRGPREAVGPGRAFDWVQLGPVDRAAVMALARTAGLNPDHVSTTFYVWGPTRRGYVVTFVEHEYDDAGNLRLVLGDPVGWLHPIAVDTAGVPEVCR